MELTRGTLTIQVDGRSVTVSGEAYLRGYGSPDFVVYRNSIKKWDDACAITDSERERILEEIGRQAREQGIVIEVE